MGNQYALILLGELKHFELYRVLKLQLISILLDCMTTRSKCLNTMWQGNNGSLIVYTYDCSFVS